MNTDKDNPEYKEWREDFFGNLENRLNLATAFDKGYKKGYEQAVEDLKKGDK